MLGGDAPESRGMIPLSVEQVIATMSSRNERCVCVQIFATAAKLQLRGWEFKMEASFLEIYNETIRDLLSNQNQKLEIKHSADGTTTVTHLKSVSLTSVDQVS